jgi:hypothetical protein
MERIRQEHLQGCVSIDTLYPLHQSDLGSYLKHRLRLSEVFRREVYDFTTLVNYPKVPRFVFL